MIYLGTPGRMVGIKCPASQQLNMEGEPSFQTTLEGRRVALPAQGVPRRAWQNQLSDASTPEQVAAVMAFVNGEWGAGPFAFVSADAPVVNLISPAASVCDPSEATKGTGTLVVAHPPMLTPDGWVGRSYSKNTANSLWFGTDKVSTPASGPVTASAYVLGAGGAVQISWYDISGGSIGTVTSSTQSTAGTAVRSHITASPPAGAASCWVSVNPATVQASRPALTWTDRLLPWADGQGCPKSVIHSASRGLVMASRDPSGGRYSNLSFVITEVG